MPLFKVRYFKLMIALTLPALSFTLFCPIVPASDCTKTSVGLIPLIDLGPGMYKGRQGGLYPRGSNTRPPAHETVGLAMARAIRPLDANGQPDDLQGKIVFLSIGMSNTTQEFSTFKPIADADPDKNPKLVIVDGAQGGMTAAIIANLADSRGQQFWATVDSRLRVASVTPAQVQIAWVKEANAQPSAAFPADAVELQRQLAEIARILITRFRNIRIAYQSSRIYAGYASSTLNPEPFAYQSGFAVKWLIEDQCNGAPELNFDQSRGPVAAPWLAWGPYLWADGLKARSDGLTYACSDLNPADGTHPAAGGAREKVARLLLDFLKSDSTAKPWFLREEKRIGSSLFYPALTARSGNAYDTSNMTFTGMAIANLDAGNDVLTFTAFGKAGNLLAGSGVTNPAQWPDPLLPGAQLAKVDFEVFGPGLGTKDHVGWFRLDGTASLTAGFFLIFNSMLTLFDGVDVSGRTMSAFILPELTVDGFTEIHIVNPNAAAATVQLELMQSNGTPRAPATRRSLAPNGALIETITELFPEIETSDSDYLRISASQGVAACTLSGKYDRFMKALNGQDVGAGAMVLYSPQYVVGGDWRSSISIVNLDPVPGSVTLTFIDRSGRNMGVSRTLEVQPEGKIQIDAQDFFVTPGTQLIEGYVVIASSGIKLSGSVSFGDLAGENLATTLPLVAELENEMIFSQLASDTTYYTGIAIVNPNQAAARVTVQVFEKTGRLLGEQNIILAKNESTSKVLWQYVPELENQQLRSGYIKLTSDIGIASFAVYGNYMALSAVPPQLLR